MNQRIFIGILLLLFLQPDSDALAKKKNARKRRKPTSTELTQTRIKSPAFIRLRDDYDRLRYHLGNVSNNSKVARQITGGVFVGISALLTGALISQRRMRQGVPRELATGVLAVSLGISTLGAVVLFTQKGQAETLPKEFKTRTRSLTLRQKVAYGEATLDRLSNRARRKRTLIGGGLVALGIGDLTWHLAEGGTSNTSFLAYKGALLGALGLAFLIFKSPAELERTSYWEAKRERHSKKREPSLSWGFAPLSGGSLVALSLRY